MGQNSDIGSIGSEMYFNCQNKDVEDHKSNDGRIRKHAKLSTQKLKEDFVARHLSGRQRNIQKMEKNMKKHFIFNHGVTTNHPHLSGT
jgi:hypothetical protein